MSSVRTWEGSGFTGARRSTNMTSLGRAACRNGGRRQRPPGSPGRRAEGKAPGREAISSLVVSWWVGRFLVPPFPNLQNGPNSLTEGVLETVLFQTSYTSGQTHMERTGALRAIHTPGGRVRTPGSYQSEFWLIRKDREEAGMQVSRQKEQQAVET